MKLGLSTASFFSKYTTEDSLKIIKDFGLTVCEAFLTTRSEYSSNYTKMLSKKALQVGIEIYSIHALSMQFEPELFNRVNRTFEDAMTYFNLIAEAASKTGAKCYTFHGPAKLKRKPYKLDYEYIGNRIEHLNNILKLKTDYNCEITYENVHWAYFDEPRFYEKIREYTNVSCCLDIKQAFQSNISLDDYIESMKTGLKNIHICDFTDKGELRLPGQGSFDFVYFFKKLKNINYDGPIMLELYPNNYNNLDEINNSIEYLNKCLNIACK